MADILCGRINETKRKKVATRNRNLKINWDVSEYLAKGEKLTSEAAVKVGAKYNLDVDTVIKARKAAIKYYSELEKKQGIDFKKFMNEFADKDIEWIKKNPENFSEITTEEAINRCNNQRKLMLTIYGKK
jgi:DNA-binding SARP family transcriptional activator